MAKARQGARNDLVENFHDVDGGKTRDKIGVYVGVSGKTAPRHVSARLRPGPASSARPRSTSTKMMLQLKHHSRRPGILAQATRPKTASWRFWLLCHYPVPASSARPRHPRNPLLQIVFSRHLRALRHLAPVRCPDAKPWAANGLIRRGYPLRALAAGAFPVGARYHVAWTWKATHGPSYTLESRPLPSRPSLLLNGLSHLGGDNRLNLAGQRRADGHRHRTGFFRKKPHQPVRIRLEHEHSRNVAVNLAGAGLDDPCIRLRTSWSYPCLRSADDRVAGAEDTSGDTSRHVIAADESGSADDDLDDGEAEKKLVHVRVSVFR
jgi:hypothetical protein